MVQRLVSRSESCWGGIYRPRAVVFRLVVFRPFPSEVILAKVKSSDEDGIRRTCLKKLRMTPLSQVCSERRLLRRHLCAPCLPSHTYCVVSGTVAYGMSHHLTGLNRSDSKERAHFWLPGSEATSSHELLDSPLTDRMYIDAGDIVRVRVESDEFHDDEPGPPKAHEGVQQVQENRRPPYVITVGALSLLSCAPELALLTFIDSVPW